MKKEKIELEYQCENHKREKVFLLKTNWGYPKPVIQVWEWLYQIVRPLKPWQNERVFIDLKMIEKKGFIS